MRVYLGNALLNHKRPNIDNWLECFYRLYDENRSEELSMQLVMALFNVCHWFLQEGDYELFDNSLKYWDILFEKYGDKEYELFQGHILGQIVNYTTFLPPRKIEKYVSKMELLYKKYPRTLRTLCEFTIQSLSKPCLY